MSRTRRGRLLALAVGALTLTACGSSGQSASDTTGVAATEPPASSAAPAATTTVEATTIATTTTPPTTPSSTEAISIDEVSEPPDESFAMSTSPTTEEYLAMLDEADIEQLGGVACATELSAVFAASDRYAADTESDVGSVRDLIEAGYLTHPLVLFELDGDMITPVAGSGCNDLFAPFVCGGEATDVTLARLTYLEITPGAAEPTQADLVEAGLLDLPSVIVDLDSGDVIAVTGGRCDDVDFELDWYPPCRAAIKTFEVAVEAYQAMNGLDTRPTEADLVDEGFLRRVSPIVDLDGTDVVAVVDGPCENLDP